jgi:hypothetical protein
VAEQERQVETGRKKVGIFEKQQNWKRQELQQREKRMCGIT